MPPVEQTQLHVRMKQGALAAIACTIINVAVVRPFEGGALVWQLLAVLVVAATAGAGAGAVYFFTQPVRSRGGWLGSFVNIVTLLAFGTCAVGLLFGFAWLGESRLVH